MPIQAPKTALACVCGALIHSVVHAEGESLDLHMRTRTQQAVDRALEFLTAGQQADGGWEAFGQSHLGVTALVVRSLARDPSYGPDHPIVKRGLAFILRQVQPNGGIYVPDQGLRNYMTSVALMALAATNDEAHRNVIRGAQDFLREIQWDGGEGHEVSSTFYGGQGYGQHKRPDLSNTQMMLEALHDSGLPADDPVYKKAMVFISRCQMLDRTNDQPFADGTGDGGFIYSPANGGESKAGTEVVDGKARLRSYGSMTYAGFKSMLYADVDRNDGRVQRCVDWIRNNYTLDHNPNMPNEQSREGLYYYYLVFAKAMQAWGEEPFRDGHGVPHPWRAELCSKLISLQRPDGSWLNEEDRWYEGNAHLVTAYAVLTLQTAMAD